MSAEKNNNNGGFFTSQEKNNFLFSAALVPIPFVLYNIAKKNKPGPDRIRHILLGVGLGLGLGILTVLLPRVISGKKTTKSLKESETLNRLVDQFSRRDKIGTTPSSSNNTQNE